MTDGTKTPSRESWDMEIVALCPLNVRVDAVFCCNDGSIFRSRQVALALCDEVLRDRGTGREVPDQERGHGIVKYVDCDMGDCHTPFPDEVDSFLGYEFDGVEKDWTENIAKFVRVAGEIA